MPKITVFFYRVGAIAANVAQSFLQASGGGNGDPMAFDETEARTPDQAPERPGTAKKRRSNPPTG